MKHLLHTVFYTAMVLIKPSIETSTVDHSPTRYMCSMSDTFYNAPDHMDDDVYNNVSIEFNKRLEYNRAILKQMATNNIKLRIPIRFVVFDGSGDFDTVSPSDDEIYEEVAYANEVYSNSGFNVELYVRWIHEYEDDTYYDNYSGPNDDTQLFIDYGDPNLINVFYIPGAGQHANFPISIDHNNSPSDMKTIVLHADYINNGWSLIHELGHTFGLFHTWGGIPYASNGSQNSPSEEYVTRDPNDPNYNCHTHGDRVCDTPAAINLEWGNGGNSTKYGDYGEGDPADCDYNFGYNHGPVDKAGVSLPMNSTVWSNVMNYGDRNCSRSFTPGQVDRMWSYMPEVISYLDMPQAQHCLNLIGPGVYFNTETFLSGDIYNGQIVERELLIESTQELHDQHQSTFYKSDDKVVLKPGFRAYSGVSFLATQQTDNCN